MAKSCKASIGKRIRATKKMRMSSDIRPLVNHFLKNAAHSAREGNCRMASSNIAQARKLAKKYG